MNVRPRGRSWYRMSKGDEWNTRPTQIRHKRFTLATIRLERDIHGVSMIESQAIMSRCLPKSADRQRVTKGLPKEFLDFRRIRQ